MLMRRIRYGFSTENDRFQTSHKICQNSNDTRLTAINIYRRDLSNELGFNVVEGDLDGLLR